MTLALWLVLVAAWLPYMTTAYSKFADGGARTYDNSAPRAHVEQLPPARRRAWWAQLNAFETFPAFAAGVIIAHIAGAPQGPVDMLAVAYVVLRLAYAWCYIYDRPTARSVAWALAQLCMTGLWVVAGMAA